jgi:hypothetical protein
MANRTILVSLHGRSFGIASDGALVLNRNDGLQTLLGAVKTTEITTAQLLALSATPQTIVPAPGSGFAIVPLRMQLYKPAGTAYGGIAAGEDLVAKYTNGSGAQCSGVVEATGFLDQATAETRMVGMPGATGTTAGSYEPVDNAAVVLHMLTGEVTTGNTSLFVRVWYDVIAMAFDA